MFFYYSQFFEDYDPFGMGMPGRSWSATSMENYRYGFNGQEQDDEVYGNANANTAEFWEYDTRLGRRLNLDNMAFTKPSWSPYKTFNDNPVLYLDPNGAKEFKDYDEYKQYANDNGLNAMSADQMGSQGHWLTSDRENKTGTWDAANEYNIKNNNINQYEAFAQIRDFYIWVDDKATSVGSGEVKWMDGAVGLVSDLAKYFDGENTLGIDYSRLIDNDMESLLIDLNVGIQNSMLPKFNWLLYGGGTLFGGLNDEEAMQWDIDAVNYEQGQIAPGIYSKYSNTDAIPKLQKMVDQDLTSLGLMNTVMLNHVPPFRWFSAKVTDTQARIDIPLLMMYPDQYTPIFGGFNGKTDPDGTLNKAWTDLMYFYQVK